MSEQRRNPFPDLGNGKCAVPGYSMGLKADQRVSKLAFTIYN